MSEVEVRATTYTVCAVPTTYPEWWHFRWLFDPDATSAETVQAGWLCQACPQRAACFQLAAADPTRAGMYGGTMFPQRHPIQPDLPRRQCGTEAGYKAHRRAGEEACRDCRRGQVQAWADRRRRSERGPVDEIGLRASLRVVR